MSPWWTNPRLLRLVLVSIIVLAFTYLATTPDPLAPEPRPAAVEVDR